MGDFRKIASPSQKLRDQYLWSLPEAQEWFLEERVRTGDTWEVPETGYAVFHGETLVEFHIRPTSEAVRYLAEVRRLRPFKEALCKSFDHAMQNALGNFGADASEVAFLFRKRQRVTCTRPEGFQLAKAIPSDIEDALRVGSDFFSSREEAKKLIEQRGLWIASSGAQIIGCGVTNELDGPYNAVDLGMVVDKPLRGQGFGTVIVTTLAGHLEKQGRQPVCGCARANLASKAALENAGFVSEHHLMRFELFAG